MVCLVNPSLDGCGPGDQSPEVLHGVLRSIPFTLPVQRGLWRKLRVFVKILFLTIRYSFLQLYIRLKKFWSNFPECQKMKFWKAVTACSGGSYATQSKGDKPIHRMFSPPDWEERLPGSGPPWSVAWCRGWSYWVRPVTGGYSGPA